MLICAQSCWTVRKHRAHPDRREFGPVGTPGPICTRLYCAYIIVRHCRQLVMKSELSPTSSNHKSLRKRRAVWWASYLANVSPVHSILFTLAGVPFYWVTSYLNVTRTTVRHWLTLAACNTQMRKLFPESLYSTAVFKVLMISAVFWCLQHSSMDYIRA